MLLMFDPTRGVEIGTKHEIYVLIRELAKEGNAILFYSTEIPELVNVCDRILVMYRGRVVKELLASPHYGERYGRHWLDVARYADSSGYGRDYFFPHAAQKLLLLLDNI